MKNILKFKPWIKLENCKLIFMQIRILCEAKTYKSNFLSFICVLLNFLNLYTIKSNFLSFIYFEIKDFQNHILPNQIFLYITMGYFLFRSEKFIKKLEGFAPSLILTFIDFFRFFFRGFWKLECLFILTIHKFLPWDHLKPHRYWTRLVQPYLRLSVTIEQTNTPTSKV